jgi:hypothetical protein
MFPILQMLVFVYAVGNEPRNLPLAIVNKELSLGDAARCHDLAVPGCDPPNLSCRFLNEISSVHVIPVCEISFSFFLVQ